MINIFLLDTIVVALSSHPGEDRLWALVQLSVDGDWDFGSWAPVCVLSHTAFLLSKTHKIIRCKKNKYSKCEYMVDHFNWNQDPAKHWILSIIQNTNHDFEHSYKMWGNEGSIRAGNLTKVIMNLRNMVKNKVVKAKTRLGKKMVKFWCLTCLCDLVSFGKVHV